jgi:hypothetical protein
MNAAEYKAHQDKRRKQANRAISFNREIEHDGTDRFMDGWRWIEHATDGMRRVGKVHEIRSDGNYGRPYFDRAIVDHNGWFTDNYQDETVCGEVYQLPARDGAPLYVPAIEDKSGSDGALCDFHSTTDDLLQAIYRADRMAERYAESEREYQAKDAAEQRIETIDERIAEIHTQRRALIRELRENCAKFSGLTAVRDALRARILAFRQESKELAKEREKLRDDYWAAVPNC